MESCAGKVVGELPYREGAIVPKPGWEPVDDPELATLLREDASAAPGERIDVVTAPVDVIDVFRRLGFSGDRTLTGYQAVLETDSYVSALHEALPLLYPYVDRGEDLQFLGTCVQEAGLWSTTTHVEDDGEASFSGLHVDNWDRHEGGERHLARRQMSINLGVDDRFLVFAATSVDVLAQHIPGEPGYIRYARELFARHPDTPIYKVRIRPGELYIAPTDNLVHDGTTIGAEHPDVTLNLRGYFVPPSSSGRSGAPSAHGHGG